jgi:hypothetical protein
MLRCFRRTSVWFPPERAKGAVVAPMRRLTSKRATPPAPEILRTKVGEVEACWTKLPADRRKKDVSAVLTLEIDDTGEVQTVEVAGVPEETQRCIAVAAIAWAFPRTDAKADAASFAFPVALKAR